MSPSAYINYHKLLLEYFTLFIFIISLYILLKCLITYIVYYFYKIELRICVFTRRSRLAALQHPAAAAAATSNGGGAAAPGARCRDITVYTIYQKYPYFIYFPI